MSVVEANAIEVRPCIGVTPADATGVKGVLFRSSLSGTPASTALTLPDEVKGAWIDIQARGVAVQYVVVLDGDSAPTLVYDQAVTIGTGHADAGAHLASGTSYGFVIPRNAVSIVFTWASGTASSFFEGTISGRQLSP